MGSACARRQALLARASVAAKGHALHRDERGPRRALAGRTGYPPFDFSQQVERAGMGYLLGRIVEETYATVSAMISALVVYLDANDAGPGFYQLAQSKGLLPKGASRQDREAFWIEQMKKTFAYFRAGGQISRE